MNHIASSTNQNNNELETIFKSNFLFNAVHDVMETMAGLSMNEVKINTAEDIHFNKPCVSGVYYMKGPKDAVLIVSIPTGVAYTLVSSFTGIAISELVSDNICDAINELTNMISGKIKAQLVPRGYKYTNSHCFAVYGQNYFIFHKDKLKNIVKKYQAGDLELVLRILFI